MINPSHIISGRIVKQDDVSVSRAKADELAAYRLQHGDVIIGRRGEMGRCAVVTETEVGWLIGTGSMALTPRPEIMSQYLYRFLSSPRVRAELEAGAVGSTMPNLSQKTLLGLRVAIPTKEQQRRIVAKLDTLTRRIARSRVELSRISISHDRLRTTVLRQAVTGTLTQTWREQATKFEAVTTLLERTPAPAQGRGGREATDKIIPGRGGLSVNDPGSALPPSWRWVSLLRLAKQETGHTPSRSQPSFWDGGVPWVGIRDAGAHHGRRINKTVQTISDQGLANSSARLLPAGTVCLSRTASVGYVTVLGRPMATSQDFATWTCGSALLPEYLMLALMAEGDDIRMFGMGSTHTTIYFPEIRALHIALPPLEEQREIVVRANAALSRANRLKGEAARAAALLDRLEASILDKAFRGELVPQDLVGEPTSALRDRIRAERAAAPETRRGRSAAPAAND